MKKITHSFNKLNAVCAVLLFAGFTASAQCPENISVSNSPGQCGATVTYSTPGGSNTGQSVNGVVNGDASNGLTGWTVVNGGSGWIVSGSYFLSSYSTGTMSQVIDLSNMDLTDAYMDTQPAITVSEQYIGWYVNYADIYSLTVELRGESDNVIASYATGNLTCSSTLQTASHVFTGYGTGVRKVYISHTGKDIEYWLGNYGAAITNAQCTVALPTNTVTQTGGLASGAEFPLGTTTNTFDITDADNVTTTCSFDVTVTDTEAPTIVLQPNITAVLGEDGTASITLAEVDAGTTDNCTANTVVVTLSADTFTCEDLGTTPITVTATDGTNVATTTANVTVVDNTAPVLSVQDVTVALTAIGNAVVTQDMVDTGTTDNCSIASISLNQNLFTCTNLGANTVTVTATDTAGNTTTGTITVTVTDGMFPIALAQDVAVQLDENGMAVVSAEAVNNGSTDNCSIASYSLDMAEFTCENLGQNVVTLTVTDSAGNSSTALATVTVTDETLPVVMTQNITVALTQDGTANIIAQNIDNGSTDNCAIASYILDVAEFNCDNLGENTVTLTITDASGNVSSATAVVTIEDPEEYCTTSGTASFEKAVMMYPNPAQTGIRIEAQGYTINKAEMTDINGRFIKILTPDNGIISADITSLTSGIYFIKIYSGSNVSVQKLIKQ